MREFGSEHPSIIPSDGYFEGFREYGHCTWLRSGREALYLIALNIKGGSPHPAILMPAYCCHSMSDPFAKAGWKIVYYRLNKDLTADIDYLRKLIAEVKPAAAFTMNFFGSAPTADAVSLIKKACPECICIEDFSHSTFALRTIWNPQVDYYMSSIRKSVGVCDGSVIISHNPLDESQVKDGPSDFVADRLAAQQLKARYAYSHSSEMKDSFLTSLRFQEGELDAFSGIHRISGTGMEMLRNVNGDMIRYARQTNMSHLIGALKGKVESVPGIEKSVEGAPFAFPILVDDRDEVQNRLSASGVYAPVLWPIADEARELCLVARQMSDRMLAIPVDQRYDYDDMDEISSIIIKSL